MYQSLWPDDIQLLRYSTWERELLFEILGYFLHFYPSNSRNNQIFKKMKKKKKRKTWRYHHFTYVDQKLWSDNLRFQKYGAWQMEVLFLIFDYFFPFNFSRSPKNKKVEENYKKTGDMILHICTKNYGQMIYGFWDMVCGRWNCYFSFWVIFCSFTPLRAQTIKFSKKWKKHLEISSFYICRPKLIIRFFKAP